MKTLEEIRYHGPRSRCTRISLEQDARGNISLVIRDGNSTHETHLGGQRTLRALETVFSRAATHARVNSMADESISWEVIDGTVLTPESLDIPDAMLD